MNTKPEFDPNAKLYLQQYSNINGRGVFLYLLSCAIGNIYIVEYETRARSLETKIFLADNEKAEKYYNRFCKQILKGE